MATTETIKNHASQVSAFLGLQGSTVGVLAIMVHVGIGERMADRSTKKPFVVATFFFFSLFPLVLLFSRSLGQLFVAFILRSLKEFGEPTRKALIMDLSPDSCKAGMFGLQYLIRDESSLSPPWAARFYGKSVRKRTF